MEALQSEEKRSHASVHEHFFVFAICSDISAILKPELKPELQDYIQKDC